MTDLLILTVFPTLVVAAAVGDMLTMRIPNWLNAALALSVLPMAALARDPAYRRVYDGPGATIFAHSP